MSTKLKKAAKSVEGLATAAVAAKRIGMPLDRWAGNCHAVSAQLVHAEVVEGVVRRGYFIGVTQPGAHFHGRVCQHSWIEMPDGRVCDPTRFAFVGGPPELWVGSDDEYDIGACKSTPPSGPPPDSFDTTNWKGDEIEYVELKVSSVDYVADLLRTPPEMRYDDAVEATFKQCAWLANLPVKDEEGAGVLSRFFAAEVYEALIEADRGVLIPTDRRDWILG